MSWNIELLIIKPKLTDFDQIGLIDIATKEKDDLPFWEASSYSEIEEGLAIGNFDESTILIDPSCRLSNALPRLIKDLNSHKVLFTRVADQSICKQFIHGKEQKESMFKSLFSKKNAVNDESTAWEFIEKNTGLSAGSSDPKKDINNSKYSLYVLG